MSWTGNAPREFSRLNPPTSVPSCRRPGAQALTLTNLIPDFLIHLGIDSLSYRQRDHERIRSLRVCHGFVFGHRLNRNLLLRISRFTAIDCG